MGAEQLPAVNWYSTTPATAAAATVAASEDRARLLLQRLKNVQAQCAEESAKREKVELEAVARVQELSSTISRLRVDLQALRQELGEHRADEILRARAAPAGGRDKGKSHPTISSGTSEASLPDAIRKAERKGLAFIAHGFNVETLQMRRMPNQFTRTARRAKTDTTVLRARREALLGMQELSAPSQLKEVAGRQTDVQSIETLYQGISEKAAASAARATGLAHAEAVKPRRHSEDLEKELRETRIAVAVEQSKAASTQKHLEALRTELRVTQAALAMEQSKSTKANRDFHTLLEALLVEKNKLEHQPADVDHAAQILWRLLFVVADWRGPEVGRGRLQCGTTAAARVAGELTPPLPVTACQPRDTAEVSDERDAQQNAAS